MDKQMQGKFIAIRLIELCEQKNMTIYQLAEKTDIPAKRLWRLSHAMTTDPGVFLMLKICNGLGVTVDEFFNTDEFRVSQE